MPDILVRNLSVETVERLEERPRKHRRSLQAEAATCIEEQLDREANPNAEFLAWADEFKKHIDRGSIKTDSAELIREDRDSYHGREARKSAP